MEQRELGRLGPVSVLTLGGGGLGQGWGATSREEAVATVRAAVDAGITLLDVAPGYGRGEAERVVGEAFGGRLPEGVRIGTKCMLGSPPDGDVKGKLAHSLARSLEALQLEHVDVLYLHSNLVPDGYTMDLAPEVQAKLATEWSVFTQQVRPDFEALVAAGRIGAWGITGVALPELVIQAMGDTPAPAVAQCIANLLDSPGGIYRHDAPFRPREIIAAAVQAGVGVLGIRAVQAGALTDAIDRELPNDDPEMVDFRRAEPFRAIARDVGESPAALAHRYSLSMAGVSTVILGVKNRTELAECVAAAARGPLEPALIARIDASVQH